MGIKTVKVSEAPNNHMLTHRGMEKKDYLGREAEDKRGKENSLRGFYQSHWRYTEFFYISVNLH